MTPFRYEPKPALVLFGPGRIAELVGAVKELGCSRALVLSTPGQTRLADLALLHLGQLGVGKFSGAVMHTPVTVSDTAVAHAKDLHADCIVAIGGGSTIGLGKAIALRTDLPQIAIPTTYAGSEMTDILGETKDGAKVTQRTLKVLPETVIYDVDLTLDLPVQVSSTSGMNAIAHGVEALYAVDGNPAISLMACEGIRLLAASLPNIKSNPRDAVARERALLGAWYCGLCLGSASMALHHKICHVLGGMFNLPHAETHSVMLPHSVQYNAGAAPDAMQIVAQAIGAKDAVSGLWTLKRSLLGDMSLASLGMKEDGIKPAAEAATANQYPNPRLVEYAAIQQMIANAFHGSPP